MPPMNSFPIGVNDVTTLNQRTVREAVNRMKLAGHAVCYDSTEDSEYKFLSARVLHFRTCRCNPESEANAIKME